MFLCIFILILAQVYAQNGTLITVNTTRGVVAGFHIDLGNDTTQNFYGQADVFLGIPYAIPPLDSFRHKVNC